MMLPLNQLDPSLREQLTQGELDVILACLKESENNYRAEAISTVTRRTKKDFDLGIQGRYCLLDDNGSSVLAEGEFSAWLPLWAIKELTPWASNDVLALCDYPTDVDDESVDWSSIRDSRDDTVWNIFEEYVLLKLQIPGGNKATLPRRRKLTTDEQTVLRTIRSVVGENLEDLKKYFIWDGDIQVRLNLRGLHSEPFSGISYNLSTLVELLKSGGTQQLEAALIRLRSEE